jgi:orotidine-5'-phosphate decarboxylase
MTHELTPREKVLVALDVDSADAALKLVRNLSGSVGGFKVGLELFNSEGPDIFARLTDAGAERIFYDAKFLDIPNTVAGAVRAAARRGVWMVNVHASGGMAVLQAARDATYAVDMPPLLIGVTVLTSIDNAVLNHDMRVQGSVASQVDHLARMCHAAGLDGVVSSAHEVQLICDCCGPEFITVVPGVRPAGVKAHDQARVATPTAAVQAGAHYLVLGRSITQADDPAAAAEGIVAEITAALDAPGGMIGREL